MTTLKKSKAIIAAILVAVTMFVSAMPVYAATIEKKKTFLCPVAVATCKLTSKNNQHADAITTVTSDRDAISAYVLGNVFNSKGDHVDYENDTSVGIRVGSSANKSSGTAKIRLDGSSSNYFKAIVSTHIVVENSKEYGGITLDIQY